MISCDHLKASVIPYEPGRWKTELKLAECFTPRQSGKFFHPPWFTSSDVLARLSEL